MILKIAGLVTGVILGISNSGFCSVGATTFSSNRNNVGVIVATEIERVIDTKTIDNSDILFSEKVVLPTNSGFNPFIKINTARLEDRGTSETPTERVVYDAKTSTDFGFTVGIEKIIYESFDGTKIFGSASFSQLKTEFRRFDIRNKGVLPDCSSKLERQSYNVSLGLGKTYLLSIIKEVTPYCGLTYKHIRNKTSVDSIGVIDCVDIEDTLTAFAGVSYRVSRSALLGLELSYGAEDFSVMFSVTKEF